MENNEDREQEIETLKEKFGIDEVVVDIAMKMKRKRPVKLADVKRHLDRAMVETLTEIENKQPRVKS